MAHVYLGIHLRQSQSRAGTRAHAQVGRPPLTKLRIMGNGRRTLFQADGAAPVLTHLLEEMLPLLCCRRPGVIARPDALGVSSDHDERKRLLRISCGEETAHRAAF